MHVEGMVVNWDLQGNLVPVKEDRTKSPQPSFDSKYLANGNSKVYCVSQWNFKDFLILGVVRMTAFQNYQNHSSRAFGAYSTEGTME